MPSKKKKYNARFPAGRIKKIMQTDEEVGKVAQAVPVIISRTLELFVESLLTKSMQITQARNAKTLTPSHMKQCILSESRFDFLKDLVKNIPDASAQEDNENNAIFEANLDKVDETDSEPTKMDQDTSPELSSPKLEMAANYYNEQSTSSSRTPVIQYAPTVTQNTENTKLNFSVNSLLQPQPHQVKNEPKLHITIKSEEVHPVPELVPTIKSNASVVAPKISTDCDNVPPLIPISHNSHYGQSSGGDNLCIDEDYDN